MKKALKSNFYVSVTGLALMAILSGCSMDATIQDISKSIDAVFNFKTSNKEIVSASQQHVETAQHYKVQSSFSFQGGKNEVITAKKYRVQTNVQATLYKE